MKREILEELAMRVFIRYHDGEHPGPIVLTHGLPGELNVFVYECGGYVANRMDGLAWIARDDKAMAIIDELLPVMEGIWETLDPGEEKKLLLSRIIFAKQAKARWPHESYRHKQAQS